MKNIFGGKFEEMENREHLLNKEIKHYWKFDWKGKFRNWTGKKRSYTFNQQIARSMKEIFARSIANLI